MTLHSCPFCFKEYECESPQSKRQYRPYKETHPKEEELLTYEDIVKSKTKTS